MVEEDIIRDYIYTFDDLRLIEGVDEEIQGAARGKGLREDWLRRKDLGWRIRINNSDDPITEFEQPLHQRSAYESPTSDHNTRFQLPIIVMTSILLHHFDLFTASFSFSLVLQ